MITVPTTLVLGAGASKPYGFPSGYELRKYLCDPNFLSLMPQFGFDVDELTVFMKTFLKSEMTSIDAFLARRGNDKVRLNSLHTYADIGKAAIAYCLIQNEQPEKLHITTDDHWYQYLWSFIADSLESFGENKLSIITFNYDRSLEFYLLTALQNSFGISAQVAAEHLKKIPILHVYGQLAALPELSQPGSGSLHYRHDIVDPASIAMAASGIRVIDEGRDDDDVFEQAYLYLSAAQRICFLGFGFDPTNVRRLRIDQLMKEIKAREENAPLMFATTIGLEKAEQLSVINKLSTARFFGDQNPAQENIGNHGDLKTERYLRATGVFIPS